MPCRVSLRADMMFWSMHDIGQKSPVESSSASSFYRCSFGRLSERAAIAERQWSSRYPIISAVLKFEMFIDHLLGFALVFDAFDVGMLIRASRLLHSEPVQTSIFACLAMIDRLS